MVLFLDDLFKTIGKDSQDLSEAFDFLTYALRCNGINRYDHLRAFQKIEGAFIETG
jgi:hypothetical protein